MTVETYCLLGGLLFPCVTALIWAAWIVSYRLARIDANIAWLCKELRRDHQEHEQMQAQLDEHDTRLDEHGETLARHDERIGHHG